MKQKRKELIETAIKLFAEKGFQSTSVQDIVSRYGISKGAFYNYFASKESLLLEIFKYYYVKLKHKYEEIEQAPDLSPREKFQKRISFQFEFFMEHRDFIVMYVKEQDQSRNREISQLIKRNILNILKKEEELLLGEYGETIQPYLNDLVLIITGIRNSYMKITVFDGVSLDPDQLASFLMERIDDIVQGMKNSKQKPLLTKEHFYQYTKDLISEREKVLVNLKAIKETLDRLEISDDKKEELYNVINFLIEETNKTEIKKYIFQGMLANFKALDELNPYRMEIAETLNIELL